MKKPSRYCVEERITIDADIHTVWQVMIDWDAYPQWNPFIVKVDYRVDAQNEVSKMKFYLRWQDGREETSLEQMVRSVPPHKGTAELVYKYASLLARLGLLRATRTQQLREQGSQTEYYTREEFHGLLARFVPLADVKQGFAAQAKALATTASALHAAGHQHNAQHHP